MANDTFRINNIDFNFEIMLSNAGGSIIIDHTIFEEFHIDESFRNWGTSGFIVYNNSYEMLERLKENSKVKNSEFFYFRLDGTDEITITLSPYIEPKSSKSSKTLRDNQLMMNKMPLTVRGIIYDTEDLTKAGIETKFKKIYFLNHFCYTAKNTNTRVSSGDYLGYSNFFNESAETLDIPILSNKDRHIPNGDLLEYICNFKLGAYTSSTTFESGYNKIFYVSNSTSSVYDDIEVLLEGWADGDGYPAYFNFNRWTEEFELQSYKTLFDNYLETQREVITFPDSSKAKTNIVPVRSDLTNTYSWPLISTIRKYKYSKMSGFDNSSQITSRSVSGYDGNKKEFIILGEAGGIVNIKDKFKGLLDSFPEGNRNPIMVLNKGKIENDNLNEQYAISPYSTVRDGIEAGLILNDAIDIELLGSTLRSPGTFIEVTSEVDTEGIWEDRFLGTWLILSVSHNIRDGIYLNNILAVKPNMAQSSTYPDGSETDAQEIETIKGKK